MPKTTTAQKINLLNTYCAGMSAASAKRFLNNVRYGSDPVNEAAYQQRVSKGGKPGVVPSIKGLNAR